MSGVFFYSYLDDLLRRQSEAAERHNHQGVLGTVRENFVIQVLKDSVDEIKLHTGEVTCAAGDLGQNDIIIRRRGTINTSLGGQIRLAATECAAVIEVKSNAQGSEITAFEKKSASIKVDNPHAICGVVTYKLNCKKETILKRMGYYFDSDIEAFQPSVVGAREYNNLDFIFCLDEDYEEKNGISFKKAFFIKKNLSGNYDLYLDPPYMQYFLMAINAVANPVVAS